MSGGSERRALLALAVLAAWPVRGALLGGALYQRDIHLVWHPQVEGFVRAVAGGAWPLWDPGPGFGQPLLADPSAMIAYPLTWLNLLLPPWLYYTLFAFAHLCWTAWGAYRLARRWKCAPWTAGVAASLWLFSGPVLSLVCLWHHFASACWMPWVLLTAERALVSRRRRAVLAWSAAMAAQTLAGSADMTAMTWLTVAAYAATRLVGWRRPWSRRNRSLLATGALGVTLAVGLTAVLWAPALGHAWNSSRLQFPEQVRTFWSVHPLGLLETVFPSLFSYGGLKPELRAALFESREPFLTSIYLGLASLPLAGAALALRRPRARFLAAIVLVGVLVALGRHLPAYSALVTVVPPLRILRYPVKAFALVALCWALLCGLGLEGWRRGLRVPRPAWLLGVAAPSMLATAAALVMAAVLFAWPQRVALLLLDPAAGTGDLRAAASGLLLAAAFAAPAAAGAALRPSRPQQVLPLLAGALAVLDVGWSHRDLNPAAPRALYARPPVVDRLREERAQRVYAYDYAFGGGSRRLGGALVPLLARVPEGWDEPRAYALAQQMQLMPATAGRWALDTGYETDLRGLYGYDQGQLALLLREVEDTPLHQRLLRMGGVTHVVAVHQEGLLDLQARHVFPGLFDRPIRLFAVPRPLPRAYAVDAARVALGRDAFAAVIDPAFDIEREVVLSPGLGPVAPAPPGAAPGGTVEIVEKRADRVRMRADMRREGYVVLLEGHARGWRATVDGRPQPMAQANLAFRAVRVPAGQHAVEMVYRPVGALVGGLVTLVSVVVALALARP